jgi:hypothetical protein
MSCEKIRELLAAVSLGAATVEERRQVEEHLLDCDLEHGEVEDTVVAALLAEAVEELAPPAALKGRLMAAALGAGQGGSTAPVAPFTPAKSGAATRRRWLRRVAGPYQVAAVLAVALVSMVAWNIQLQSQPGDEKFVHYYRGDTDNWMLLETELGTSGAHVSLGGLETLAGDTLYHLWATRGSDTVFVGVFNTNGEGQWAGDFDFTFYDEDRLWITAQGPGDGEGPQGDAVLRTRF